MVQLTAADWHVKSQCYSFLANSFLKVMTPETAVGLDSAFWISLAEEPLFSGECCVELRLALVNLSSTVARLSELSHDKAVERVAVEYTRLFIGPGEPAAAPWETLYRQGGGTVLFGQSTFDMRQLLGQEGYQASPEAHQFEDHLGFELLYLALRCARFARELEVEPEKDQALWLQEQASFIEEHPLGFIDVMQQKAAAASSVGYYSELLLLTRCLLACDARSH